MPENNPSSRCSHASGCLYELAVLETHYLTSYHSCDGKPADHCKGNKEVHDVPAENGHEYDDQQHVGQAIHDIDQTHQEEVNLSTQVACKRTHYNTDEYTGEGPYQPIMIETWPP